MVSILDRQRERWNTARGEATEIQETADGEDRELTADESRRVGELCEELETLKVDVDRRERMSAATAETSTRISKPVEVKSDDQPTITFPSRARYGALKAFKARHGETQKDADERAYRSGMWLRSTIYGDTRATTWCREHGMDMRAQVEGINKYGGAVVPSEMSQSIIDLREEYGVFRKNTRVMPMASDHMYIPRRVDGVTVYAMGENPASGITTTEKEFDQVELTARKWGAYIQLSTELADDAIINMADDLAAEIAHGFANKEDDCAFNGDGTAAYQGTTGILAKMIDGNHTGSYYTAEGGGNTIDIFSEVTTTTLAGLMGQLPGYVYSRGTPKWYVPVAGKQLIFGRLMMAAGGNNKTDAAGLNPETYAGYEIVPVPVWTGIGTTDFSAIVMVLFGDMSLATTLGDRRGTSVKVSSDRLIEYDMLAVVGTTRFDINIHDVGQLTAAGPLVGLLGN